MPIRVIGMLDAEVANELGIKEGDTLSPAQESNAMLLSCKKLLREAQAQVQDDNSNPSG